MFVLSTCNCTQSSLYWRVSQLIVLACNRYDYHIVDDGSMGPEESEASRKRQVPAVLDFPYMCLVLHVSFWKRNFKI